MPLSEDDPVRDGNALTYIRRHELPLVTEDNDAKLAAHILRYSYWYVLLPSLTGSFGLGAAQGILVWFIFSNTLICDIPLKLKRGKYSSKNI